MRKLLLIMLGMLLFCAQLLAQNRTIKGKVLDEEGKPVPGASVSVKGTRTGTITDANGQFTLDVSSNAKTLVITGVGFTGQEITIGSQTEFSINLKQDARSMDQVIITGYTREKKNSVCRCCQCSNLQGS